jgi:hypothetical protein
MVDNNSNYSLQFEPVLSILETKVCTTCHKELPITEFHKNGINRPRRADCKSCRAIFEQNPKRKAWTKARHTREYAERKAAGLCTYCGLVKPERGGTQCSACYKKKNTYTRARFLREGKCVRCGNTLIDVGDGKDCITCINCREHFGAWRSS